MEFKAVPRTIADTKLYSLLTLAMVRPSSNTSRTIFFEFRLITFVRVCHFNHLHFHFDYIIYSSVGVITLLYHLSPAFLYF